MGAVTLPMKCHEQGSAHNICQLLDVFALHRAAIFPWIFKREVFTSLFGAFATAFVLSRFEKAFSAAPEASK